MYEDAISRFLLLIAISLALVAGVIVSGLFMYIGIRKLVLHIKKKKGEKRK